MNNKINYNYNIFFFVNNYYIYLLNPQHQLKYNFHYFKNNYFLEIKNKNNEPLNIFFKIIDLNNSCYYYNIFKNRNNFIKLNNFRQLKFHNVHKDNIQINNNLILNIDYNYPNLQLKLYNQNLFDLELNSTNKLFLKYNWYYFGIYNKYQYFKYIIYKNKTLFNDLYQKIDYNLTYDINKKYSLIFIDDRFDNIFENILITFLYSVDNDWNLHIYTIQENVEKYNESLKFMNIHYKITIIKKFENVNDYSNLLKTYDFWNKIKESHVLIFQYDSLAFKKFDYKFINLNYIGAQWPDNIQQVKGIYNGNGGTSLRNVETMKYITSKYNYNINDKFTPEDVYFAKYLFKENKLNNNKFLCDEFSFENVHNDNSIYGHAIYESIELDKIENYISNRITKLLFI